MPQRGATLRTRKSSSSLVGPPSEAARSTRRRWTTLPAGYFECRRLVWESGEAAGPHRHVAIAPLPTDRGASEEEASDRSFASRSRFLGAGRRLDHIGTRLEHGVTPRLAAPRAGDRIGRRAGRFAHLGRALRPGETAGVTRHRPRRVVDGAVAVLVLIMGAGVQQRRRTEQRRGGGVEVRCVQSAGMHIDPPNRSVPDIAGVDLVVADVASGDRAVSDVTEN